MIWVQCAVDGFSSFRFLHPLSIVYGWMLHVSCVSFVPRFSTIVWNAKSLVECPRSKFPGDLFLVPAKFNRQPENDVASSGFQQLLILHFNNTRRSTLQNARLIGWFINKGLTIPLSYHFILPEHPKEAQTSRNTESLRSFNWLIPMPDPWDDCIFTQEFTVKNQLNVGKRCQSDGSIMA